MGIYILKRLAYMVVVFFIITGMLFVIYKQVPTDPVLMWLEGTATSLTPEQYQATYDQIFKRLNLDKPLIVQYGTWVKDLLSGQMGYSGYHKMPVARVIGPPIGNTVKLNSINLIIVFCICIPLGIKSAVKRGKVFDNTTQVVTLLGYSLPNFVISILAIILFAVVIPIFPINGSNTAGLQGDSMTMFLDTAKHMVLPLLVMSFASLGGLTRYVRAAMIEALSLDCVRTARAKGLREKVVIYSHAMRNAQITVITALAGWFIGIFSGSVMIERLFLWNGMGNMLLSSVRQNDWAVVFAINMFYVVIALVGHLIIDLIYAAADPRIRLT